MQNLTEEELEQVKEMEEAELEMLPIFRRHKTHCLCPGCGVPTLAKKDIRTNNELRFLRVKLIEYEMKEYFCRLACYHKYLEESGKVPPKENGWVAN